MNAKLARRATLQRTRSSSDSINIPKNRVYFLIHEKLRGWNMWKSSFCKRILASVVYI